MLQDMAADLVVYRREMTIQGLDAINVETAAVAYIY
jgi:hypothetical protein